MNDVEIAEWHRAMRALPYFALPDDGPGLDDCRPDGGLDAEHAAHGCVRDPYEQGADA